MKENQHWNIHFIYDILYNIFRSTIHVHISTFISHKLREMCVWTWEFTNKEVIKAWRMWELGIQQTRLGFQKNRSNKINQTLSFNSFIILSIKNTSTPHGITRTGYTLPIPSTAVAKILNFLTVLSPFRPFDLFSWKKFWFFIEIFDPGW